MQIRLKNKNDVRYFSVATTGVAVAVSFLLLRMIFPSELLQSVLFVGELITIMLTLPLSYFIGTKLLDVNDLTLQLGHAFEHDNLTGACTRLSFYHRLAGINDTSLMMIVTDIETGFQF